MGGFEFIQVGVKDGIASVTLNRPPLNVLSTAMLGELNGAVEPLVGDRGIAAIVLRAAGKAFSAGVDIADHTPDKVHGMIGTFHGVFRKLAATDAVTIAAVNGAALGGGCELACFCDVVLVTDRAKFGQPEMQLGVFAPAASCLLPPRIGQVAAEDLLYSGRSIGADEARSLGLVHTVAEDPEADRRVALDLGDELRLRPPVQQEQGCQDEHQQPEHHGEHFPSEAEGEHLRPHGSNPQSG